MGGKMIKDITIGQYYPTDSIIHKLDPRVKLLGTIIYIISLFIINSYIGFAFAGIILFTVVKVSKVPFKFMFRGLKSIFMILLLTVIFNLFIAGDPLLSLGFLTISVQGVHMALKMGIRLILLILGSSLMTFTTTPNNLTDGLESLLNPLNKIKVPVHEISMMMSIALRFIPILMEETDKIMKAQMARGADFETGGLIKRAKSLIPLLVPLFVSAFRRANDLAMAMEARCYHGGEGRTKMKPLKYKMKDIFSYLLIGVYVGAIVLNNVYISKLF
jgi:energy-coupling factor transport system permease protein